VRERERVCVCVWQDSFVAARFVKYLRDISLKIKVHARVASKQALNRGCKSRQSDADRTAQSDSESVYFYLLPWLLSVLPARSPWSSPNFDIEQQKAAGRQPDPLHAREGNGQPISAGHR
jgi:hypothetical protein